MKFSCKLEASCYSLLSSFDCMERFLPECQFITSPVGSVKTWSNFLTGLRITPQSKKVGRKPYAKPFRTGTSIKRWFTSLWFCRYSMFGASKFARIKSNHFYYKIMVVTIYYLIQIMVVTIYYLLQIMVVTIYYLLQIMGVTIYYLLFTIYYK